MIEEHDWRLEAGPACGREAELKSIPLYYIPFEPLSDRWDHEHCVFCWAKFFRHPECLQEGYCTRPQNSRDADWICPECYEDFEEMFGWTLLPDPEAIDRITRMESVFDALRADPSRADLLRELKEYYEGGQWLRDYEMDEAGLLPPDLKRGVLSQDGVYDLLEICDNEENEVLS